MGEGKGEGKGEGRVKNKRGAWRDMEKRRIWRRGKREEEGGEGEGGRGEAKGRWERGRQRSKEEGSGEERGQGEKGEVGKKIRKLKLDKKSAENRMNWTRNWKQEGKKGGEEIEKKISIRNFRKE